MKALTLISGVFVLAIGLPVVVGAPSENQGISRKELAEFANVFFGPAADVIRHHDSVEIMPIVPKVASVEPILAQCQSTPAFVPVRAQDGVRLADAILAPGNYRWMASVAWKPAYDIVFRFRRGRETALIVGNTNGPVVVLVYGSEIHGVPVYMPLREIIRATAQSALTHDRDSGHH